ncbi:histidine--tRNA ligase [Candidatus Kaiserbacteria bacterium]|nr:histidine--tRNA ligase [Candidatus Kaiserbacteria bacterium]USN88887.1 MAG: histidine--tRNA ligase [Candidatus Nomurabacteria bacterium]
MSENKLSTDAYKGVRDFYPEDMAVERYIFDTWAKTAESFGFERYDASILEPSDLYKAKGAENEEMVNEQTYTFTDRGDREVTLRPEMTPTVARMVAGRRRELQFPLRWYSIPNLFRYERPQRGRLREHWQLNCDIFGVDHYTADIEIILLANKIFTAFGADQKNFTTFINHRELLVKAIAGSALEIGIKLSDLQIRDIIRLNDRRGKLQDIEFNERFGEIVGPEKNEALLEQLSSEKVAAYSKKLPEFEYLVKIGAGLKQMNIETELDIDLARGFDYYTGTIFEVFETDAQGNKVGRAMLGGGRYDNLAQMFSNEPISGVGFGMGDVTMRDFLETHNLLPKDVHSTTADVVVIPMTADQNLYAQIAAEHIRRLGKSASTDISTKKVGDKISRAAAKGAKFVTVIGENEMTSDQLTFKNLETGEETSSL